MSGTLNILAVDTATRGMSVSVFRDGVPVVTRVSGEMRDQAKSLLPSVMEALKAAELGFSGLDALAAATGPGSFTGIRVGLAAMQGIALASGLPLAGFDNFSIYALPTAPDTGRDRLVLLESHRKECFCQLFDKNGKKKDDPFQEDAAGIMARFTEKEGLLLTGNAVPVLRELDAAGYHAPDIPDDFAAENSSILLGRLLMEAAEVSDTDLSSRYPAKPFYIRPPDVTMPKDKPKENAL
ncbi:MAG: tRNA (adenosine(37)-N6)-threonylcarbamoyltransferase complex dimerization subunit type 1 TsaB [Pseudomonadota bacterium]|nr:tRNA (adenosine(37)-N6)-threonylcarbamoyltransferase complex dimerization subunit type 1 TsaB [Pseudomonadota bacterium]QKK05826.1 MAG: tRNA (adenosine(37)-N6)-threonylcarbamoyltransferase complex dimerization subunit type 1 TsaB [Pseudomonadota bacterium]